MQVTTRRVLVISAIAIGGALSGLAIGHFVAGGPRLDGGSELANYSALFTGGNAAGSTDGQGDDGFAAEAGPSNYQCQGCDAHLTNDMVNGNAAETEPLPPDVPDDAAPPPRPADSSAATPAVRGTPAPAERTRPAAQSPAPVP
jgi:hypothetical protein